MGKLFGTDGIRGVVGTGLTAELAYKVGRAAAQVLAEEKQTGKPLFVIGKDTRISSDLLESALVAGLCSMGADVMLLGVIPTPAVAYLTVHMQADAGIVISASHNPYEHNGIKVFGRQGYKLSDELEERIEMFTLSETPVPDKTRGDVGRILHPAYVPAEEYAAHLAGTVETDFAGMKVLVDCANGAASVTAPLLFSHFPNMQADLIHAEPDGVNINTACGSTHTEDLAVRVREGGYQIGIAFDGDADRCLAVDENGCEIDGDQILAVCGRALKNAGQLPGNTIVATIMSNLGLHRFAAENGMNVVCTNVGDRNVLENMLANGYTIGGEQSGHTIFSRYATTGDGELSALQLLQLLKQSGGTASELVADCPRYPQAMINVPVADREMKRTIMDSPVLRDMIAAEEARLAGSGRVLVRPSGTEALIRVMVEAQDEETAQKAAESLAESIKNI